MSKLYDIYTPNYKTIFEPNASRCPTSLYNYWLPQAGDNAHKGKKILNFYNQPIDRKTRSQVVASEFGTLFLLTY